MYAPKGVAAANGCKYCGKAEFAGNEKQASRALLKNVPRTCHALFIQSRLVSRRFRLSKPNVSAGVANDDSLDPASSLSDAPDAFMDARLKLSEARKDAAPASEASSSDHSGDARPLEIVSVGADGRAFLWRGLPPYCELVNFLKKPAVRLLPTTLQNQPLFPDAIFFSM
jgi:hypothetical protein